LYVLGVLVLDHASSATFVGSSLVGMGIKLKEVRRFNVSEE